MIVTWSAGSCLTICGLALLAGTPQSTQLSSLLSRVSANVYNKWKRKAYSLHKLSFHITACHLGKIERLTVLECADTFEITLAPATTGVPTPMSGYLKFMNPSGTERAGLKFQSYSK